MAKEEEFNATIVAIANTVFLLSEDPKIYPRNFIKNTP
jgi:hypothetical protein